ncbi:hypothetical protein ACFVH9_08415 [Streptomyces hirsutus]|uniref:hypothetical protein n=1 Tax=Streptomyces hirsutus TaxID=35620 RepID=UPI003627E7A5
MNWIKTYESSLSFPMQCVRHLLAGESVEAYMIVSANTGYGLATCAEHREVTGKVVAELLVDDDEQTKALFARHGSPVEPPADEGCEPADGERGPGEGVVYGQLPGAGGRGPSRSATDVMLGRLDR